MAGKETLTVAEAADIVKNDTSNPVNAMNAFAGAKVTFLNTELGIKFLKKGDNYTLLLAPEESNGTKVGTTLQDLIDAIGKLVGDGVNTENLTNLVGDADKFKDITIQLTMAFLYINKKDDTKEVEYAFMINVENLDKLLPTEFDKVITLGSIQLAIWNTGRKNILKAMKITTPDDVLDELYPQKKLDPPKEQQQESN